MSTDNEWPEGATHKIATYYLKWVDGIEHQFIVGNWCTSDDPWPLDVYLKRSGSFKITERPVEEPKFIPEVGDWCEVLFKDDVWDKRFFVGLNSDGHRIYHTTDGHLQNLTHMEARPVKPDRDVFIDRTAEAICDASIEQLDVKGNVRRIAGILFDAGFKVPEASDE